MEATTKKQKKRFSSRQATGTVREAGECDASTLVTAVRQPRPAS